MFDDERFEDRDLFVELTTEERQDRAKRYVECDAEIERLKSEQKASNERYKRDIGALVNKKESLGQAVQDGKELRETECEWKENFEQKCWDLVRLDFSEDDENRLVDQRTMTATELQGNLEFENDGEQSEGDEEQSENDGEQSANDDSEYSDADEPEYASPKDPPQRGKKKAAKTPKKGTEKGKAAAKKKAAKKSK